MNAALRGAAFVAAAALLAACSKSDVDQAQNAIASAVPKIASDVEIGARVEGHLAEIDPSSALHVAISVHGGDVRLSGSVRDANVEKRFIAAANGVRDVKHVTAALTVDANLPNVRETVGDYALEASVRAKLVEEAGINGINLHVLARDGNVTISGDVPSQTVAATIRSAAQGVRGVKHVAAQLKVQP